VRNSTGEIIQFVYGGDGLVPIYIEAASSYADEDPLDHIGLQQAFNTIMETNPFNSLGVDFKYELR
jgi:hypothetical protein